MIRRSRRPAGSGEVNGAEGASVDVPVPRSVDVPSVVLAVAAAVAIFRFRVGMLAVLLVSSLAGVFYALML